MTPKVSVVIPVYNAEKYLEKCLDSVLGQTLSSVEIICVDDGSTDASPQILAAYARRSEKIHILRQPNGGLSVARNSGIDEARGDYLLFLDSDDSLAAPQVLRQLLERAEADQLDMLFFEARLSYESDALQQSVSLSPDFYQRKCAYPPFLDGPSLYLHLERNDDYLPNAYLYLLRREFLQATGLRFPPGIYHEDEFFTLAALALAKRASCIHLCGYDRLWREGSIMTERALAGRIRGNLLAARALLDFSRKNLRGVNKTFLRRYRAHAHAINRRGYRKYASATPDEREAFWNAAPKEEHPVLRAQLRAGKRSQFERNFRRAVKRLLPENLLQNLKQRLR